MRFVRLAACPRARTGCRPADGWCTHPGAVKQQLDCEGDGLLDWTCKDVDGNRGLLSSKLGCASIWPSAPVSSCPAAFLGSKSHTWTCSTQHYTFMLLLICTCSAHAPAAETVGLIMHASGKQPWMAFAATNLGIRTRDTAPLLCFWKTCTSIRAQQRPMCSWA